MAVTRKTWVEKFKTKSASKRVRIDTAFAGIPAGSMLFVATPKIVDQYLRRIPKGATRTVERLRADLAKRNRCDATCPLSTAIFLRIAAEVACEQMTAGAKPAEVTPFWRVVDPDSSLAKKLSCGAGWIAKQRAREARLVRL
jgi:hypothetical protein